MARPPHLHPTPQAGFTLLEVIISIVVLGFILAGMSQGARVGMHAWDLQTRAVQRAAELDRLDFAANYPRDAI